MRSGHRFPEPLAELRRMPCASATVLHPGSNLRSRRDAPSRRTGLSSSTLTSARAFPVFLRRGGRPRFVGAVREGELGGRAAAGGCSADAAVVTARRSATVFTGFAARIEAAHGIQPGWTAWLTEDTI